MIELLAGGVINDFLKGEGGSRRRRRIKKGEPFSQSTTEPCSGTVRQGDDLSRSSPTGGEYVNRIRQLADDLEKFELDINNALMYAKGSHTYADIVQGVFRGELHFYPLENSFIICQPVRYPQKLVYHVFLAGGSLKEILAFQPVLEANGRELGCSHLTLAGRRGWEKALKEQGWELDLVVLSVEIDK